MLRNCVRLCFSPIRGIWRCGLGGTRPIEKLLRRAWLSVFLLIVVGIPLSWFVLFAQFHLVQPANAYDWVGTVNAEAEKIPDHDRAWPLYQSGFGALTAAAYLTAIDPETGQPYFIRDEDLRGHFEFATDATRKRHRKIAGTNAFSITRFIEASKKPQLGCAVPAGLEQRLDSKLHPRLWPMPRQSHVLQGASELLRHAFLAAGDSGDSTRVLDLTAARLRIARHHNQIGPWMFISILGNHILADTSRDVCFFILQEPELFTDPDLEQLAELFADQVGFASDPELVDQAIENTLDQCYTADGSPCGNLIKLMQATYQEYGSPGGLTKQQQQLLRPQTRKDQLFSLFALPVLVQMMPSRDELREQLEAQAEEARQIAKRQPWEDRSDRYARTITRLSAFPEWKDLPAFLFNAEWFEVSSDQAATRLATTRLLIALEQHRRKKGKWPATLDGFTKLVPPDPYADQAVQYRVENGKPIIWSVGEDGADDGGTKLTTSRSHAGHDWQLVPQQDSRYLEWVRQNRTGKGE